MIQSFSSYKVNVFLSLYQFLSLSLRHQINVTDLCCCRPPQNKTPKAKSRAVVLLWSWEPGVVIDLPGVLFSYVSWLSTPTSSGEGSEQKASRCLPDAHVGLSITPTQTWCEHLPVNHKRWIRRNKAKGDLGLVLMFLMKQQWPFVEREEAVLCPSLSSCERLRKNIFLQAFWMFSLEKLPKRNKVGLVYSGKVVSLKNKWIESGHKGCNVHNSAQRFTCWHCF